MLINIDEIDVRPYGVKDLIDAYTGQEDDEFETEVSMAGSISAVQAATNSIVDGIDTSLSGNRDTAIDDINDSIDAIIENLESMDNAALVAALNQLKTDQAATINAVITFDAASTKADIDTAVSTNLPATATVSKVAVLTQIKADLQAAVNAAGLDNACGRCISAGVPQGRYPESNDTKVETDTRKIHCKTCDGWGYADEPIIPTFQWPES